MWIPCGVLLVLATLAAACTAPSAERADTSPSSLTIGVPEGNVTGTDLGVRQLAEALSVETLAQWSIDGRVVPRLAERWTWEEDGRRLRITLRPDVTFHDGTRATASVMAQILRDAVGTRLYRMLYPSFGEVTAVTSEGDLDLLLDLSEPDVFLLEDLEFPLSLHGKSIGTGPYRVVKEEPSELVLERFDRYYRGSPQIGQVTIRPFSTLRTAWTSLLRGEVDMVTDVPPDAVEFVNNEDVQVLRYERTYQYIMAYNSRTAPFNNPTVRRALNSAIDRNALVKRVLNDRGTPSTGPIWPKHWAYDANAGAYGHDVGITSSLLDSAGYPVKAVPGRPAMRFRFVCLIPSNFSVIERMALEVQRQLYNAGIDMQFEVVPPEQFDARVREGRFEAMLIDLISGPTLQRSYQFWRSGKRHKGLNVFGYENEETEQAFQLLKRTTNEAAMRSATARLQRAMFLDPPALFLAWNERSRVVRRNFQIVQEEGRDPLQMLWRWTEKGDREALSTQ